MAEKIYASSAPVTFENFWEIYPRKISKRDALKAWLKLDPDPNLCDRIAWAISWQVHTWDKLCVYVPYPATWLRGERWNDEMPEYIRTWLNRMAGTNLFGPDATAAAQDILEGERLTALRQRIDERNHQTTLDLAAEYYKNKPAWTR